MLVVTTHSYVMFHLPLTNFDLQWIRPQQKCLGAKCCRNSFWKNLMPTTTTDIIFLNELSLTCTYLLRLCPGHDCPVKLCLRIRPP